MSRKASTCIPKALALVAMCAAGVGGCAQGEGGGAQRTPPPAGVQVRQESAAAAGGKGAATGPRAPIVIDRGALNIASAAVAAYAAAEADAQRLWRTGDRAAALSRYRDAVLRTHRALHELRARGRRGTAIGSAQVEPLEVDAAMDYARYAMLAGGDRIDAVRPLLRVAIADYTAAPGRYNAIDRALRRGDFISAFGEYRAVLFPGPSTYGLNAVFVETGAAEDLRRGLASAQAGDNAAARTAFESALRRSHEFRYPLLFLGILDEMANQRPAAVRWWKRVLASPGAAEPGPARYDWATLGAMTLLSR